jgi:hypothetical protein
MFVRLLLSCLCVVALSAQEQTKRRPARDAGPGTPGKVIEQFPVPDPAPLDVAETSKAAIAALLKLQEGEQDQWPYEGVYREDGGQLPVGYRVGGTCITCLGLVAAPGYATDAKRKVAAQRALGFVLATLDHERMQIGFKGGYDVRGWGHIYALTCFLQLQDQGLVPGEHVAQVAERIPWLVKAGRSSGARGRSTRTVSKQFAADWTGAA